MKRVAIALHDSGDLDCVIGLFCALRLSDVEPRVVHVVEPVHPAALMLPPEADFGTAQQVEKILDALETSGKDLLQGAKSRLIDLGINASTVLRHGHPVDELIRYCADEDVDLVVMGSEGKGPVASALFGSVSRAMAQHARSSLAIAKQRFDASKRLHAVLATDHSKYMDRCVEELLYLAPRGIQRLDIVTAFTAEQYLQEQRLGEMPVMSGSVLEEIIADLEQKNEALKKRLGSVATVIHSHVVRDHAIPAIQKVMHDVGAEILILGAHGHSAIERLLMGSVSHHMVAVERFSVWILRPRNQA